MLKSLHAYHYFLILSTQIIHATSKYCDDGTLTGKYCNHGCCEKDTDSSSYPCCKADSDSTTKIASSISSVVIVIGITVGCVYCCCCRNRRNGQSSVTHSMPPLQPQLSVTPVHNPGLSQPAPYPQQHYYPQCPVVPGSFSQSVSHGYQPPYQPSADNQPPPYQPPANNQPPPYQPSASHEPHSRNPNAVTPTKGSFKRSLNDDHRDM